MSGWSRTLFARVVLILLIWLIAAQGMAYWVVMQERSLAVGSMMIDYAAKDIAGAVALLERLPAGERAAWLPKLERANYRYSLAATASATTPDTAFTRAVLAALSASLEPMHDVLLRGSDAMPQVELKLLDGTPITIALTPPRMRVSVWLPLALLLQLAILLAFAWFAVRVATRPLARLAAAADAFGSRGSAAPLPENGPTEVAHTAAAFNAMQRRIVEQMSERLRILGAVSHDLQTPITRMRLRAEMLDAGPVRERLLSDLQAMQSLVEEGLVYARSAHAVDEVERAVDLHALLDSISCDYADAGAQVHLNAPVGITVVTRPNALRRVVVNLVDNALKFGGDVEIQLRSAPDQAPTIAVLDRGPGIPEDELESVFEPFHRVESSRNRDSGGTGLGLAIARNLAHSIGAGISLSNRSSGGLEALITLPPAEAK